MAYLTYYFTNAGVTGRTGGTQAQFDSAYSNSLLKGQVTVYSGIQEWVVPLAGTYQLEAWGAQGSGGNGNTTSGGKGAYVKSEVFLNAGDILYILVGQAGTYNGASVSDGSGGGGGGASIIARKLVAGGYNMTVTGLSGTRVEPLIVAAGGGGSNDGRYRSPINGTSGVGTPYGGNLANQNLFTTSFLNGGGGTTYSRGGSTGNGGFGGGTVADDNQSPGGGWYQASFTAYSYYTGDNVVTSNGNRSGQGAVTITRLNTPPMITGELKDGHVVKATIQEVDGHEVSYRILVNREQVFPKNKEWTDFALAPVEIEFDITGIMLTNSGSNMITIEYKDTIETGTPLYLLIPQYNMVSSIDAKQINEIPSSLEILNKDDFDGVVDIYTPNKWYEGGYIVNDQSTVLNWTRGTVSNGQWTDSIGASTVTATYRYPWQYVQGTPIELEFHYNVASYGSNYYAELNMGLLHIYFHRDIDDFIQVRSGTGWIKHIVAANFTKGNNIWKLVYGKEGDYTVYRNGEFVVSGKAVPPATMNVTPTSVINNEQVYIDYFTVKALPYGLYDARSSVYPLYRSDMDTYYDVVSDYGYDDQRYLVFNGSNTEITFAKDWGTTGQGIDPITVEGWFWFDSGRTTNCIWGHNTASGANTLLLGVWGGQYNIDTNNGMTTTYGDRAFSLYNQWVHIAFSMDGTVASIYENGVLRWKGIVGARGTYNRNPQIGQDYDNSSKTDYFKGRMRDFRVWNEARTEEQVNRYMNTWVMGIEPHLMVNLPFNDATGSVVKDKTRRAYNGTVLGTPVWGGNYAYTHKLRSSINVVIRGDASLNSSLTVNPNPNYMKEFTDPDNRVDITPTMSADTVGAYRVVASSVLSTTYSAFKAFNHTVTGTGDSWLTPVANMPATLDFYFPEGELNQVTGYAINMTRSYTEAPKSWTIEASHDRGATWRVIHAVVDDARTTTGWRYYNVPAQYEGYNALRIKVTNNMGSNSYVSINEMYYFASDYRYGYQMPSSAIVSERSNLSSWLYANTGTSYDGEKYGSERTSYITARQGVNNDIKSRVAVTLGNTAIGEVEIIGLLHDYLPSSIQVNEITEFEGSIKARQTEYDEIDSSLTVVRYDDSEIKGWIQTRYNNDVPSALKIRAGNKMSALVNIAQPISTTVKYNPLRDAFVRSALPKINYGSEQSLVAGFGASRNEIYRSLFAFDVSPVVNLPEGFEVSKAELRLKYAKGSAKPTKDLRLYTALAEWAELGVTWDNRPEMGEEVDGAGTYTVNEADAYIAFNLTDLIVGKRDEQDPSVNLYLKAVEEIGQALYFYSKEMGVDYSPELVVTYIDYRIWSYDKSEITASIYPKKRANKDVKSFLKVKGIAGTLELPSSLHVLQPGERESSIAVNRPDMSTSIEIRQSDKDIINSSLTIREVGIFDFADIVVMVTQPNMHGTIIVPHHKDTPASLSVRLDGYDEIITWMTASQPSMVSTIYVTPYVDWAGSVTVRHSDESLIDGNMVVSTPDRAGMVFVPYTEDLASSIIVKNTTDFDTPSTFMVSRDFIFNTIEVLNRYDKVSKIRARREDESEICGALNVSWRRIPSSIFVRGRNDITSTLTVRNEDHAEADSLIVISRPDFAGGIQPRIFIELQGTASVQRTEGDDQNSSLYVLERKNIPSKMDIVGASMIPSSIHVLSGYLNSHIRVPNYGHSDIPSSLTPRLRGASDIPTTIFVVSNSNLPSTVIARRKEVSDIPTQVVARQNEDDDIPSTINTLQFSLIDGSIAVRREASDDVPSSTYILHHKEIKGRLFVRGYSNLPSSILAVIRDNYDVPSSIYPKSRDVSDIPTALDIKFRGKSGLKAKVGVSYTGRMKAIVDVTPPKRTTHFATAVKDAYVREGIPTLNYGAEASLVIGSKVSGGDRFRTLLGFDISQVPQHQDVESVVLKLHYSPSSPAPTKKYRVLVTKDFDEYGVTWKNQPSVIREVTLDSNNYAVNSQEHFITFDITEYVNDAYLTRNTDLRFYVVSMDETEGGETWYFSRESGKEVTPKVEVTYFDSTPVSYGRSELPSSIGIISSVVKHDTPSKIKVVPPLDWILVDRPNITLHAWDNGAQDGDIVNIYITNSKYPERKLLKENWLMHIPANINIMDYLDIELEEGMNTIYYEGVSNGSAGSALTSAIRWQEYGSRIHNAAFPPLMVKDVGSHWIPRTSNEFEASIAATSGTIVNGRWQDPKPYRTWKIVRPSHRDVPSSLEVTRNNWLASSMTVSTPDKQSNLTVRRSSLSEIPSSINARSLNFIELEGLVAVSRPDLGASLYVNNRYDIPSTIRPRVVGEAELQTFIQVSRGDMGGSVVVTPAYSVDSSVIVRVARDSDILSLIAVSKPDIEGSIDILERNDLPSTITVSTKIHKDTAGVIIVNSPNLVSDVYVLNRFDILSVIGVPFNEEDMLAGSIVVSRPDLIETIYVLYRDDIDGRVRVKAARDNDIPFSIHVRDRYDKLSSLEVIGASMLPSSIQVLSGWLASTIKVPTYMYDDLDSVITVRWSQEEDIESVINVTHRFDTPSMVIVKREDSSDTDGDLTVRRTDWDEVPSTIFVRQLLDTPSTVVARQSDLYDIPANLWVLERGDLPGTVYVRYRSDLTGSITVRRSDISDIPANVHARGRMVSNIPSSINVMYRGNSDLRSRIAVPPHNKMTAKVFIIPVGDSDIVCSITVRQFGDSDLLSSIAVRRTDNYDMVSTITVRHTDNSDIPSTIDVWEKSLLPSEVAVRRTEYSDLPTFITVHEVSDLPSTITARRTEWSEIPSTIVARQFGDSDLKSSIRVAQSVNVDLPSTIDVWYFRTIPSSIYVLYHADVTGSIEVIADYGYCFIM
ncbi:concanavalin A-like lectin/glucanase superfamily protein [Paenibacillus pabuli]|uniref:receptor protein-tyrosine kinase n=1 Tax=Paenibacillus pabuli TaxID=1472 RepID=A0ABX9BCB3_9BACL|nr:DNRLRE domain-containing protein [Paenibacillus pabuli]RAI85697.1 concanavalin A-like lectin/glucanase superfamily protein [Paenibacillus pabuli]